MGIKKHLKTYAAYRTLMKNQFQFWLEAIQVKWLATAIVIYFAFTGQWYVLYNAPYFLGIEALPPLTQHGIEWIYVVGIVPYLLFIRSAFRPESAWATAVAIAPDTSRILVSGG